MPHRRRQALAMLSAVDDGVGLITAALKKARVSPRRPSSSSLATTAPRSKSRKLTTPGAAVAAGDGSLNDPLNGEKGMLAEGGMHTSLRRRVAPARFPVGQTYPSSGQHARRRRHRFARWPPIPTKPGDLDGVNLIPHLTGDIKTPPHEALYWRWIAQSLRHSRRRLETPARRRP